MLGQRSHTGVDETQQSFVPVRADLSACLNEILANQYVIFTKTLNFHWNLTGPQFYSIHVFLEEQYKELLEMMDKLAERIRYLNGRPLGTVKEMELVASVDEDPGYFPSIQRMLGELYRDHEEVNRQIEALLNDEELIEGDKVTEDVLISLGKHHQKMIWMLRSHFEPKSQTATPEQFN